MEAISFVKSIMWQNVRTLLLKGRIWFMLLLTRQRRVVMMQPIEILHIII